MINPTYSSVKRNIVTDLYHSFQTLFTIINNVFVLKIIEPAADAGIGWTPISRSKHSPALALLNCIVRLHSKLTDITVNCILPLILCLTILALPTSGL